jgi:transmembrane sensor
MSRTPLRDLVPVEVDRAAGRRMWLGVVARREARRRARGRTTLVGAFAFGLAAAMIIAIVRDRRSDAPAAAREAPGLLKTRAGVVWNGAAAPEDQERTIDLEDGSRIELGREARLEPLDNTDRSVVVLLAAGRAVFDIRPGGPRRWSIEAGLATVEVVGTRFAVSRSPSRLVVEVERGLVLVRGERVPDRVQRLAAGARLEIDAAPAQPASASSAPPSSPAVEPVHVEPVAPRPAASQWSVLAERGDYDQAYETLGQDGVALRTRAADGEELLKLADVARFSGHPRGAVAPLERFLSEHRSDPRAPLAAFTLGRVHLDALNEPAAAARHFETAISLGMPQALLEDAYLRLIDARARAGDRHGAHEAWAEYHEKFPNSTRRLDADQWRRQP